MKSLIIFAILLSAITATAQTKTYFQTIAGNWSGTLEYLDYQENKRVKLKTYLTVIPAPDGNSAEFQTVYDDVTHIVKDSGTEKIDLAARKYAAGDSEYKIESLENGKIVLLGSGQDGEKVEPVRKTITFDENSLVILKETRTPWQFRHQLTLKRTNENPLAKKTLGVAQMLEDLRILQKTLTTMHPGVYRYQTVQSLDKIFRDAEAKLKNPLPEGEFFLLASQIVSRLYCGHTFANPYNQDSFLREKLFNGKTYLPFYFRIIDGKFIMTENASPENLAKGSEIVKINGVPVKQIIEKLLTVTASDGRNTPGRRLQQIELPRFEAERYALFDLYFPLFFPLDGENFQIEAKDFQTKKLVKFQTPALTKAERTAAMAKRYGAPPTYDDGWKFEIQNDSTAYLKIDNSITWRLKKIDFKKFLADAFAELRAKNIRNLIIDLRGNGGGDMTPGFELSRYLAQRELPAYAEGRRLVRNVSAQPELAKSLQTYSDWLKDALKQGFPSQFYRKFDANYFEVLPNENTDNFPKVTPYENNFRGQAYVIADASNASATFQFLDYVKNNKLAKIVGQPSGGNLQGINGGNYYFLYLPNSKVEFDIPVYFQAPLTPQKDEGVTPDVYIRRNPADIGNGIDAELEYINKAINQ